METNEALTVQKLLSAAAEMEKMLSVLGLNEDEKNQVGTYYFALRLEIDRQLTPPPTIIGSLPEGFVPPKPTYEDLERSLKSAEKKYLLALIEVRKMQMYWRYQ